MTDDEFELFLQDALDELMQKQNRLISEYELEQYPNFWYEQTREILQFLREDKSVALEAKVIDIGSYNTESSTWMWAWDNGFLLPSLRVKAEPLKTLSEITGYPIFSKKGSFKIEDKEMTLEFTAMAVKFLNAKGFYRLPSEPSLQSFLAIMAIEKI